MELKLLKRYSITIKYANLIFYLNFKAYSGVGKAAHCQLGVPCSVPAHATNFYTSTPVIEITTTIVDHISCMWSKVDNFSCYFSTNSRENFTTNLLVFRTREISKGVDGSAGTAAPPAVASGAAEVEASSSRRAESDAHLIIPDHLQALMDVMEE